MLTPKQFMDAVDHETRVIKHLATKVLPGSYDWRPTPAQRSILELMKYLTSSAIVPCRAMIEGNWDASEALEAAAETVTPATFAAAMDAQRDGIAKALAPLSDRDYLEKDTKLPWGTPVKLGEALVRTVLYTLVAYRMQLFLYLKQSGVPDIGPAECWVGVTLPKKPI